MKKFFKFGCLGIIGIVVLFIVVALATGGGEDTTSDTGGSTNNDSTENSEGSEEPQQTYGMGENVPVGAVSYTVNSRNTGQSVGPEFIQETTEEMFLILEVSFTNNGNEAVTVDSSYFELVQGDTTFSPDSEATISANSGEDNSSFFLEEVNPGSTITGTVVFDVIPDVAEAQDLKLKVQEGMFGSVTETINLQ